MARPTVFCSAWVIVMYKVDAVHWQINQSSNAALCSCGYRWSRRLVLGRRRVLKQDYNWKIDSDRNWLHQLMQSGGHIVVVEDGFRFPQVKVVVSHRTSIYRFFALVETETQITWLHFCLQPATANRDNKTTNGFLLWSSCLAADYLN